MVECRIISIDATSKSPRKKGENSAYLMGMNSMSGPHVGTLASSRIAEFAWAMKSRFLFLNRPYHQHVHIS